MSHPDAPHDDSFPDVPRKAADEAPGILDQPARTKRWMRILCSVAFLLLLLDLLYTPHFHADVEAGGGIFGFYGVYGFLGLVALVLGAKLLRGLVMRPEDYYDQ